jgi:hypothetical protein
MLHLNCWYRLRVMWEVDLCPFQSWAWKEHYSHSLLLGIVRKVISK